MIIPFNIKTDASILNSLIKVDDLIETAKQLNYKALTITDNKMYNVMQFYKKCIDSNIKPIVGLEIEINNHIVLLYCKNINGYYNLVKINNTNDYNNIDCEGLIAIIPYESLEIEDIIHNTFDDIYYSYKNEIEYKNLKNKKCIYINKINCLKKSDTIYLSYLESIRNGSILREENSDTYLITIDEYKTKEKNIHLHEEIYNKCNLEITYRNDLLPIYNNNSYETLKKNCIDGLKTKIGNIVSKKYQERIKYELNVIKEMGFCDYFLIVQDYVKYAKENGIIVGPGRGSAAGSLVAYILDITDIDPIKYDLLFERFLNKMRVTMPDIDIDFDFLRREEVINYVKDKYGKDNVAGIITFGTLTSKQVIRDVSKCIGMEQIKTEKFLKCIDSNSTLKQNYDIIANLLSDEEYNKLYNVSLKLEGLKRHTSVHPAGIIISSKNLNKIVPLEKKENLNLCTYSMEYLEELGLLKMDFLALKNLTIIKDVISSISNEKIVNFNNIPLDDKKTFDLFKDGNTLGIFQFEKQGMMNFLKKLKPNRFEDISLALALYRPGPMEYIDNFIARKNGLEKIDYIDPVLETILSETYGIIIYQEQIMQIACTLAGYTLGEADILRRAISKKKESILLSEKEKFINKTILNNHSKETGEKVFNYILKFASYGFNKSHSVAYAMISYKMAYLKANYPEHFSRVLLTSAIGSSNTTEEYFKENKNFRVKSPNINISESEYTINDDHIIYPLTNIKNIGLNVAKNIINERKNGLYKDLFDFLKRTDRKIVNRKVIESLILSGAFDDFEYNRKTLFENLDEIINYCDLLKEIDNYAIKPLIDIKDDYTNKEKLNHELELFGFYLTNHPVIEERIKYKTTVSLKNIENYFDKIIDTIIIVDSYKEIENKNKERMAFIEGSDENRNMSFVLFSNIFDFNITINKGDILLIRGKVEKRFDKYQIIINKYKKI